MSGLLAALPSDPVFYLIGYATVFIIAISKGAFGGGLAILGVPLLSLVMPPLDAAITIAPLICFMDLFAIGSFGRDTWSKPDLKWILPALIIGIVAGYVFFTRVNPHFVAIAIGLVTLSFAAHWLLFTRNAGAAPAPASPLLASLAGFACGFTTFVAHAGGPPMNTYLLRRGLDKSVYAGTSLVIFMTANWVKVIPYAVLAYAKPATWLAALVLAPAIPFGVWLGIYLHRRLEQNRLYFWCYLLLAAAASKLLFDALRSL
jgi:uncharacterized membrane protein YfcA